MEAEKCKINASADLVPGEALPGSQVSIFSLCPHRVEGMREQSGTSYIKALILFMRASPSELKHLPKAPLPNTITLSIKISICEFGEDRSFQILAEVKRNIRYWFCPKILYILKSVFLMLENIIRVTQIY